MEGQLEDGKMLVVTNGGGTIDSRAPALFAAWMWMQSDDAQMTSGPIVLIRRILPMRVHHINAATLCPLSARLVNGEGGWLARGRMVCTA